MGDLVVNRVRLVGLIRRVGCGLLLLWSIGSGSTTGGHWSNKIRISLPSREDPVSSFSSPLRQADNCNVHGAPHNTSLSMLCVRSL